MYKAIEMRLSHNNIVVRFQSLKPKITIDYYECLYEG